MCNARQVHVHVGNVSGTIISLSNFTNLRVFLTCILSMKCEWIYANCGVLYNWLIWRGFLIWRFLANAHQRQIKDHIKICLHKNSVVLTAPDAKINTGKILF